MEKIKTFLASFAPANLLVYFAVAGFSFGLKLSAAKHSKSETIETTTTKK